MALDHSKYMTRFVEEVREHCTRMSNGLLALDADPGDVELLNALFRSAHTIKGSSKMMKLPGFTGLANQMEDVLDAIRTGRVATGHSICDALLSGVDTFMAMLVSIAAGETSPIAPAAVCDGLVRAANPAVTAFTRPSAVGGDQPGPEMGATIDASEATVISLETSPAPEESLRIQKDFLQLNAAKLDELIQLMGEIVSEHNRFRRQARSLGQLENLMSRHLRTVAQVFGSATTEVPEGPDGLIKAGHSLQQSLQSLVQAVQDTCLVQDNLIADLKESSLKLRMLPLSTVFDPLRRTVRDTAQECGKEIRFVVSGGETELDRKIIDAIGDSLLHMIRNSIDHGIESPQERQAAGKPPHGVICLSADYDGDCVTISLSDDGRGLDTGKIREKAHARRLLDDEVLAAMSRSAINNLIFLPGLSTSPIITDFSGRGVGLDVVRRNVSDNLKGSIHMESEEGKGTTFILRLPLNQTVLPLFLVSIGREVCALQYTSIVEMLTVPESEIIDVVHRKAITVREQLIPIADLAALAGIPKEPDPAREQLVIIIVRDGDEKLGLIVEDILETDEMIVRPLPSHLKGLKLISGVSIGDRGNVVNVLHVPELIRLFHAFSEPVPPGRVHHEGGGCRVLVVDDSLNTREIERDLLEAYGYTVVTAGDGQEAFEKACETQFDLVITDVEMPILDGFSLTERLRSQDNYCTVPIIIVSSREKDEDKKRGIFVGANAYIVKKSFDQSGLLETIRSLIG